MWGRQVLSTISSTFVKSKANPAFKYIFPCFPLQLHFNWEPVKQKSLGMVGRNSHLTVSQAGFGFCLEVCSCVKMHSVPLKFVSSFNGVLVWFFSVCKWVLWWFTLVRKVKTVFLHGYVIPIPCNQGFVSETPQRDFTSFELEEGNCHWVSTGQKFLGIWGSKGKLHWESVVFSKALISLTWFFFCH